MDDVKARALAFLDEVSAPLTVRQVERALRDHGVSRTQSVVLASTLARFTIIAIEPTENRNA